MTTVEMFKISVFLGLLTVVFSLVGWVVVCNKLHQPWDFGLITISSFAFGLTFGCGLYAVLTAIQRRKNEPVIYNLSLEEAVIRLRDAVVGPIQALGDNSEWVEDEISVKSKPDSSNTQILSFHSMVEDIDTETRRLNRFDGGGYNNRISTEFSLTIALTGVGERTRVEVYAHSVQGISTGMYNLVLDDARSIVKQTLTSY